MTTENLRKAFIVFLLVIACAETALIIRLLTLPKRTVIVSVTSQAAAITNPLYWAFKYDAPDQKIYEIIRGNPTIIESEDPSTGWSALLQCAESRRTNCFRMFIINGVSI